MESVKVSLQPIFRLLPRLRNYKKKVLLIFAMLLGHRFSITVLNVVCAGLVAYIMEINQINSLVWWVIASAGVFVILVGLTWWLDMWFAHVYSYKIIADLRLEIFNAIDRINPSGLQHKSTGDVAAATMADTEITEWFYAHTIIDFFATVTINVFFTIVMVILVGAPGLILLIVSTIILLIPILTLPIQTIQGENIRFSLASQKGICLETIQGSREIISFGLEHLQSEIVRHATLLVQKHKRAYVIRSSVEVALSQLIVSIATIGTLTWLLALSRSNVVSLSHIPPSLMLLSTSCNAALGLASMMRKLGEVSGATRRFFALTDMPYQIADSRQASAFSHAPLKLEFNNVSFGYDTNLPVLRNFNLKVNPGNSIALVGRTGAGKSTIAALAVRLFDPWAGSICIDGKDISTIPLSQLRELVTLVPQQPYIFRGTVKENLLLAKPEASDDELWNALHVVHLDDTVSELPKQLENIIGERGTTLSGGQRQRFNLAQAFLRDSPIVILDEAVSNLDSILEREISRATNSFLKQGRTIITIAHRLSTIRAADQVAFLDSGKIMAVGTHDDLLNQCFQYKEFVLPRNGDATPRDNGRR